MAEYVNYNIDEMEIKTWRPQDGDVFVARNTELEIDADQANEIRRILRKAMDVPEGVNILVVGRDWEISCYRQET